MKILHFSLRKIIISCKHLFGLQPTGSHCDSCSTMLWIPKRRFIRRWVKLNIFKCHVSSTNGKISVRIKIEITFIFRLHCRSIQSVMLVAVGLVKILTSSAGLVGFEIFFLSPSLGCWLLEFKSLTEGMCLYTESLHPMMWAGIWRRLLLVVFWSIFL